MANGATLESIEDISLANIGLTVVNEDTSAKKDLVIQIANAKLQNNQIDEAILGLVLDVDNWKLQMVILSLAAKDKREADEAAAELAHQRQMEGMDKQLQIAKATQAEKTSGKMQEIDAQNKGLAMLQYQMNSIKGSTQAQLKELTSQLKMQENEQKAELAKDKATHEKSLEEQAALAV